MNEKHVQEKLSAYLDQELDVSERTRVERHLEDCPVCRQELAALQGLESELRGLPTPDPGQTYWTQFARRVEERTQPEIRHRHRGVLAGRLRAWFFPHGSLSWLRGAGAVATITLLVFVGIRGFRPTTLTERSSEELRKTVETAQPKSRPRTSALPAEGFERDEVGSPARTPVPREIRSPEREVPEADPPPIQEPTRESNRIQAQAEEPARNLDIRFDVPSKEERSSLLAREKKLDLLSQDRTPVPVPDANVELSGAQERERAEAAVARFVLAAVRDDRHATEAAFAELESQGFQGVGDKTRDRMIAWMRESRKEFSKLSGQSSEAMAPEPAPSRTRAGGLPGGRSLDAVLALDELVWPRRQDPALRDPIEVLARELAQRGEADERARRRALVYLQWLVDHTRNDQIGPWQELLRRLAP